MDNVAVEGLPTTLVGGMRRICMPIFIYNITCLYSLNDMLSDNLYIC